ncbi:hypothetical protein [Nocardia sp. NPDC052566]|uniref:hypothetical protein n=1 Tax=Nocardia sp. NPDC052566 TaxID=3364330 RepID=UPI0037C91CE2
MFTAVAPHAIVVRTFDGRDTRGFVHQRDIRADLDTAEGAALLTGHAEVLCSNCLRDWNELVHETC